MKAMALGYKAFQGQQLKQTQFIAYPQALHNGRAVIHEPVLSLFLPHRAKPANPHRPNGDKCG